MSKSTVLAIEDEDYIRDIIVEVLSEEGFEVLEAENGEAGIKLAQKTLPDLIICDISMPELDGYGVLKRLREMPQTQTIPFIFLTANVTKEDRRAGMNLGADDYLTKPFSVKELLDAANARLRKHEELEQHSQQKFDELRKNLTLSLPHELLTPLTGIMGFAALLEEDSDDIERDEIREMAGHISTAGKRLYRSIQNYLLFAQLELVAGDADRSKALLNGATSSAQYILGEMAVKTALDWKRKADLHLDLVDTELEIADRWLEKMVSELTDNGFKFSPAGTVVEVTSKIDGDRFVWSVRDRGRGLTPEQIDSIGGYVQFERKIYEQQGSGLGLAISQRLVELYGGELDIDSTLGEGTIVRVTLPRS